MKKLLIMSVVLFVTAMNAHTTRAQQWANTYGGSDADVAYSLQETSDGGYVWSGSTGDDKNAWVVRTSSDGTIAWQKTYGGSSYDWAASIQETSFVSGYIIAGYTESFGAGGADVWVLKLNTDGTVAWEKAYGDVDSDEVTCVRETSDEGYIAAGRTNSFGDGDSDMWVLKLDSVGDITWQYRYGGGDFDRASCIEETPDPGGYIMAGDTWSVVSGITGDSDIAVVKLDSNGYIAWQKTYGDIDDETVSSIQETSDGGYIVAGATRSFGGISKAWVLKLTSAGAITWQKTYGDMWSYASSVKETSDGGYIVAGDTYDYGAGWSDTWVLKLTSAGAITWQKTYGGSDIEWIYDVEETTTGDYIMAGTTYSFGAGESDVWVLRIDSTGDIPDCTIIDTSTAVASDTTIVAEDAYLTITGTTGTATDTAATVGDTSADESTVCPFTGEDTDGDGVTDGEDNCPNHPNGSLMGTCTSGNNGALCMSHSECDTPSVSGYCSMAQEDSYPPGGNDCGDACECEGDFDSDLDVKDEDITNFKASMGRFPGYRPCSICTGGANDGIYCLTDRST